MNKNETKYLNTARLMNEALLLLLEKKNYEFITVKEICEKAGVNRSTFYLHYETIDDLLTESLTYLINKRNDKYKGKELLDKNIIENSTLDELVLITPGYILPYLEFAKENKRVFLAAISQPQTFRSDLIFDRLFKECVSHIMARFNIPEADRRYMLTYYLNGMSSVIISWIQGGCKEETSYIARLLIDCVRPNIDGAHNG